MHNSRRTAVASTDRPNVLLIMADDMGWSDIGCYGGEIATPHLDDLAVHGGRFTQFYNTARCSPSRASLLTGLDPHLTGIGELVDDDRPHGYAGSLNDRCATLAEMLAGNSYQTFMSGKWHLSSDRWNPNHSWPTRRGFEAYWGTISGAASYFQPTTLHDGECHIPPESLPDDFFYTDAIGEHGAQFIRDAVRTRRPFFGYVAFTAPHWPLHAVERDVEPYLSTYAQGWDRLAGQRLRRQSEQGIRVSGTDLVTRDPEVLAWSSSSNKDWQARRMAVYAAQVTAMDRAVGGLLAALDETGQRDNTLIIFLSDNGACAEEFAVADAERIKNERQMIPASSRGGTPMRIGNTVSISPGGADTWTSYGRAWANLSNTPFRLYKRWTHEGGIASPLIISWRGGDLQPNTIVADPCQLTDIAPTILEATKTAWLSDRGGNSIPNPRGCSMLARLRGTGPLPARPLYWEHIGNGAIRDGRWKLVREHGQEWELYDMSTDRGETRDCASDFPDLVDELAVRWQTWAEEVGVVDREHIRWARARGLATGTAGG